MSWLWGGGSKKVTDGLDGELKDFLKQETRKQQQEQQTKKDEQKRRDEADAQQTQLIARQAEEAESRPKPLVPPESQFQDGRYAHLWKTYKPMSSIEAETMTSQDHLKNVLDNFKDRQAAISRAATENCVLEQMAQHDCFLHGSWAQLATMCRAEGKAFGRCFEMQSRFLKALGYLSQPRSHEEEERIQMHADKLYHEMLDQEKMSNAGGTVTQKPIIPADEVVQTLGHDSAFAQIRQNAEVTSRQVQLSDLTRAQRKEIMKRLENMTEEEKAVELQLAAAEHRADLSFASEVKGAYAMEAKERAERKAAGKPSIGDRMKVAWGWDDRAEKNGPKDADRESTDT